MTNNVYTQSVLTFDGEDDYIDFRKKDFHGVFSEGSSAFTVSGWVKPHRLQNKATTYGVHNVFFARSSDRYSDNFEFGISEAGNLDVYIDEKIDNVIKTFGNGELTVQEWHFFAIVFHAGQLTIYLDDHEYTGSLAGSTLNRATSAVTLGATLHNHVYFTGQLLNIAIWNYSCSREEIQKHRSESIVGNEPGLVAYWTLNAGQGTTVKDLTGNAHDGILHGNPTWELTQLPITISQGSTSDLTEQLSTEQDSQSETANNEDISFSETEVIVNIEQQPEQPQTLTYDLSSTTMNTPANSQYKILAIDGGGIRGIIPAIILSEIEKRTQKQIFSLFDLIAGTSSGGILALGLTKPRVESLGENPPAAQYSAEELLQIYLKHGAEIFYEPWWEKAFGPLEDIFIQPKYSSESREEILKKYFGNALLENNLKEVFVTSYDIEQRIPIFFTNKLEKQETSSKSFRKLCKGFSLLDTALATSATPTYFPPHCVVTSHNTNGFYTLIDGGVYANNPAHLAILEAQISRQEQQQALNIEDILVVSLGTGSLTSVYPYEKVKNWGLLQWAHPLLNIAFDGNSEVVAGELDRLFASIAKNHLKSTYYRFQPLLNSQQESIDDTTIPNLRQLQTIATKLIKEKSQEIDELCSILSN